MDGGIVQAPPCGPIVAGAALYFSNTDGPQLSLTNMLDLTNIGLVYANYTHGYMRSYIAVK